MSIDALLAAATAGFLADVEAFNAGDVDAHYLDISCRRLEAEISEVIRTAQEPRPEFRADEPIPYKITPAGYRALAESKL